MGAMTKLVNEYGSRYGPLARPRGWNKVVPEHFFSHFASFVARFPMQAVNSHYSHYAFTLFVTGRGGTTQPNASPNLPHSSDYPMASCIFEFVFEEVPQSTKDYCLRFPWFATLLNDASLQPIRNPERWIGNESGNAFLARTLNTKDTIPACQSFYKSPSRVHVPGGPPNLGELQTFYSLHSGLDGHEGFCHGGSLSAAMDSTMATLARSYPKTDPYTKYLHVSFRKPFRTPGALLCRVWLARKDGRKLWISGRMEDAQGNLYITAEGLFVDIGPKL